MQGLDLPAGVTQLVLLVDADVNEIARLGKNFPWVKPPSCPCCHQPLWWHGFTLAYFAVLPEGILLRRLRCSCCKAVHRLKPHGFWKRFRSGAAGIKACLEHRLASGHWDGKQPRDRQRQWWRRLHRMAKAVLGLAFAGSIVEAFVELGNQGYLPVSSSFYRDNAGTGPPPYRSVPLP